VLGGARKDPMTSALELLKTRRSPRIPDLTEPGPSASELETLLTVAARVPDHGKLVPWRFLVMQGDNKKRIAQALISIFRESHPEATEDQIRIEPQRFSQSPVVIAVISRAAPHPKIPEWEQILSAGAACMNLVVAAHALGYGANWVSGWAAYDRPALTLIGIGIDERVAGFIHIGTPRSAQEERSRPALNDIVKYL
jgi:nitroreductase